MKDYRTGLIRCRCSNEMRIGKLLKIFQFTHARKACPNCGKLRKLLVRKKQKKQSKSLITVK